MTYRLARWALVLSVSSLAPLAGCAGPGDTMTGGHHDTGVGTTDGATDGATRSDANLPVDASVPHDTNPPRDGNVMLDAVGGGAGLMCTACTTDADCRAGSYCVQLASSGDRVCLQNCNAEIPSCPRRFDCLNSILTPTPGPVCTPVGERCCIDSDEDDYGFGVGCRGSDCDDNNPNVYLGATETCNSVDDNCDGTADDGNPGGGNLCMGSAPGVCSAGMTMCNAGAVMCAPNVAVGAMTESCNGLDDDCDGPVDESFAFMGDPLFPGMSFPLHGACAVGLGACRRAGAVTCATGGASAVCSATAGTPGTETCNYADDDCNGHVDDPFTNAAGVYTADTDCGACGIDCTAIYMHPGSFGTCNAGGARPTCQLNCNPGAFNLNAIPDDGCEFALDATAIYVSGEDPGAVDNAGCGLGPVATGGTRYPCRTITFGQGRATSTGRTRVLVADALYNESITLVNGQSLLGGYRADTWERHLTTTLTTIRGTSGAGHRRTISATNINTATLVEGFVIEGASATTPGANSYAVYVSGGTNALTFRSNVVYAGAGAPGSPGGAGADGLGGVAGTIGMMGFDTGSAACATSRAGSIGGARTCGATVVSGGGGGGVFCQPVVDTAAPFTPGSARVGGVGSGAGGGAGGGAGFDGATQSGSLCNTCFLGGDASTTLSLTGANGLSGSRGGNGGAGAGAASGIGSVSAGDWLGDVGGAAGAATPGGGGGGGGSGGGGDGQGCTDDLGATGGGGGSGACGGTAGGGGGAGGGSFGIFIVGTASYPTLTGNTIYRSFGGTGGNGGRGGTGGVGGSGAAGGTKCVLNACFCTGDGGTGGNGGDGGHGGGGGGGAGGVSYGVYAAGTSGYGAAGNTFPVSGGGGAGGGAGPSIGLAGTAGANGTSANTN